MLKQKQYFQLILIKFNCLWFYFTSLFPDKPLMYTFNTIFNSKFFASDFFFIRHKEFRDFSHCFLRMYFIRFDFSLFVNLFDWNYCSKFDGKITKFMLISTILFFPLLLCSRSRLKFCFCMNTTLDCEWWHLRRLQMNRNVMESKTLTLSLHLCLTNQR